MRLSGPPLLHIPSIRIPWFGIFYSTTYTVLLLIICALLLLTPADLAYQSFRNGTQRTNIPIIAGVYFLTVVAILLIYSTRIYTNRSVLAAIPKGYVPVEEGEVGKSVRRMVKAQLERSCVVAFESRPRDVRLDPDYARRTQRRSGEDRANALRRITSGHGHGHGGGSGDLGRMLKLRHAEAVTSVVEVDPERPPWGVVNHPGWSSPGAEDLPGLQFQTVVPELPNLIEAKAVSLAPPDPLLFGAGEVGVEMEEDDRVVGQVPDAGIVALLQRPVAMGLRDYLARLGDFGLINPPSLGAKFLTLYEEARFSGRQITEKRFRELMEVFAAILGGMNDLDLDKLFGDIEMSSIDSASTPSLQDGNGQSRLRGTASLRSGKSGSSSQASSKGSQIHHLQTSRLTERSRRTDHASSVAEVFLTPGLRGVSSRSSLRKASSVGTLETACSNQGYFGDWESHSEEGSVRRRLPPRREGRSAASDAGSFVSGGSVVRRSPAHGSDSGEEYELQDMPG